MENKDILESLKCDMVEQEKLFNDVRKQMVDVANEYNKKLQEYNQQVIELNNTIAELEAEGNKELKRLQEQQEYYRGAYTGLYNQFIKFGGNMGTVQSAKQTSEVAAEDTVKDVDNKPAPKKNTKKTVANKKTNLTEDDLQKIQSITKTVDTKPADKDIPEYLRDEYNK